MRLVALLLVLALAACVPTTDAALSRSGTEVTAVVTAVEPLFDVTLSLANATTGDERCVPLEDGYTGCFLGDLLPGESATVRASSEADASCVAFGYSRVADLTSYRPWPCRVH